MKKIAIIGCAGIPAAYGGFESCAEYLTQQLSGRYRMTVYCSARLYPKRKESHNEAKLTYIPLKANGMQSIPYDMWSILNALIHKNDILLILGVSGCVLLPVLRFFGYRRKIVVNIDGLEWRREKWKGWSGKVLKFFESCAVHFADVTVCDNKVIVDYLEEEYSRKGVLIEYGADHQPPPAEVTEEGRAKYPFLTAPYAFSVCRIEPENNVHLLLEAFSGGNMPLVIVGNWEQNSYSKSLRAKYSENPMIHLLEPIYQVSELNVLRANCTVYVHGHSCGGTNPSLIEAMYLGLPIIAFDVNFNRETTENQALYFRFSQQLTEIYSGTNPEELEQIGIRMRAIAERRYSWKRISALYAALFE